MKQISCALLLAAGVCLAQSEITLPGTRIFPESITSTNDGTFYYGSLGNGNVMRIPKGKTGAEEFIRAGTGGLNMVLGVLADEKASLLWVCSNNLENKGEATALKAFDLKSGAPKASYPLEGGFCNDIAVGEDGSAYIADTRAGSVLMVKKGGKALELVAKDPLLAGADGLAFGTKNVLYVNSVTAHKLLRLELGADGKSTKITELTPSKPFQQPDGMRRLTATRFLLAEGAGRMSVVNIAGDKADVQTIFEVPSKSAVGVTVARGMAWVVEGKLNLRTDATKDPGTFKVYSAALPK